LIWAQTHADRILERTLSIFFYAGDREEPVHIHVEHENQVAKFWLDPVRLQNSGGFSRKEIGRIHRLVEENQEQLLREWHEYFDG
jgi:hypothetical protein